MTLTLSEMTDSEIEAAVAEHVAGLTDVRMEEGEDVDFDARSVSPWEALRGTKGGKRHFIPRYLTDFNAVLPLLEKYNWTAERFTHDPHYRVILSDSDTPPPTAPPPPPPSPAPPATLCSARCPTSAKTDPMKTDDLDDQARATMIRTTWEVLLEARPRQDIDTHREAVRIVDALLPVAKRYWPRGAYRKSTP